MKISVIALALTTVAGTYGIVHHGNARQQAPIAKARFADTHGFRLQLEDTHGPEDRHSGTPTDYSGFARTGIARTPTKLLTPTNAAPADRRTNPEAQVAAEQRFEDHVATVAANFNGEPRDPPFAINTSDSLKNVLGSEELANVPVHNIDCRTLTCRIEISDDGSGVVAHALPILTVRMAETLPNVLAQRLEQPNGQTTMVLYMSK